MKKVIITLLCSAAVSHAATTYMIDINDADDPLTAPGWTGLNATHTGNGGTVNVDGVDFGILSSDGSRIRGGSASPNPNALLSDFVFDDGSGQAVIVTFGGPGDIAAGTWRLDIWSLDSGAPVGNQILGFRTNGSENNAATINGILQGNGIVTNSLAVSSTGPAGSFTFLSDGTSRYDVFLRENNSQNRSRINAVMLTYIPEPSSAALLGFSSLAMLLRRRR